MSDLRRVGLHFSVAGGEHARSAPLNVAQVNSCSADRYLVATDTARLDTSEMQLLTGVLWPGATDQIVSALLVAPSGVWLLAERPWTEIQVVGRQVLCASGDVSTQVVSVAHMSQQLAGDLVRYGLAPTEVHAAIVVPGDFEHTFAEVTVIGAKELEVMLAAPGRRLTSEHLTVIGARIAEIFTQTDRRQQDVPNPSAPPSAAIPQVDTTQSLSIAQICASLTFPDEPVPQWQTFLDPVQAVAAWKPHPHGLRLRGGFGTGASVVAAHRAAHLAETTEGRVALVVSEPAAVAPMRQLVRAVCDRWTAEQVLIATPEDLATNLLHNLGTVLNRDPEALIAAWKVASISVPIPTVPPAVVRNEVLTVIRGRGLAEPEQYDQYRPQIPADIREQIWTFQAVYAHEVQRRNVADASIAVNKAQSAPRIGAEITSVVIDGANDLTLIELEFLRDLVGPASLTLIDDGLASTRPGAGTLSELGLEPETIDLRRPYRLNLSTWSMVVELLHEDHDPDLAGRPARPQIVGALPQGAKPLVVTAASAVERRAQVVAEVTRKLQTGATPAQIGVISLDEPEPELLLQLRRSGIGIQSVDGESQEEIRVGAARQTRGTSFAHVLVADATDEDLHTDAPQWDNAARRRLLAVAVSRANESVWICTAAGEAQLALNADADDAPAPSVAQAELPEAPSTAAGWPTALTATPDSDVVSAPTSAVAYEDEPDPSSTAATD